MIPIGKSVLVQAQLDSGVPIGGVVYSSSNSAVAEVWSEDGVNAWIRGMGLGTATIMSSKVGNEAAFDIDTLEVVVVEAETPEPPPPIHGQIVVIAGPE